MQFLPEKGHTNIGQAQERAMKTDQAVKDDSYHQISQLCMCVPVRINIKI